MNEENRKLLRKYGFNDENQDARDRLYAIHMKRAAKGELDRRNVERAWRLGQKAALRRGVASAIRNNARKGVQGYNVHVSMELEQRQLIAKAITSLVGVLQDLMEMSGSSLSQAIHTAVVRYGKERLNKGLRWIPKATVSPTAVSSVLHATQYLTPNVLWSYASSLLVSFLGTTVNTNAGVYWARATKEAREAANGILAGKDVDVRPFANAFIMSLDAGDLSRVASRLVDSILEDYLYASSTGESSICKICVNNTPCASPKKRRKISILVKRALVATNQLLSIQGLSITKVLRQAVDRHRSEVGWLKWRAVEWASATIGSPIVQFFVQFFYPQITRTLKRYGLGIGRDDLVHVIAKHGKTIGAFIYEKPDTTIDQVIVDIVVHSKPVHLVQGGVAAALGKPASTASAHAFCALCFSQCPKH